MPAERKPKLAVWKFASCDGCQLSLLDCEDELLDVAGAVEIAYFPEATRSVTRGPYDVSLVEGSITTPHDAKRIADIRKQSKFLVTIGACATAGGIQALRNGADGAQWVAQIYSHPEAISSLAQSTPIASHVKVDFELWGCPVSGAQMLAVVNSLLLGVAPRDNDDKVCTECKRNGYPCVMVSRGIACMGPVTRAGCGALCPGLGRDCYGCYGPAENPNTDALAAQFASLGLKPLDIVQRFQSINSQAPVFLAAADKIRMRDDA